MCHLDHPGGPGYPFVSLCFPFVSLCVAVFLQDYFLGEIFYFIFLLPSPPLLASTSHSMEMVVLPFPLASRPPGFPAPREPWTTRPRLVRSPRDVHPRLRTGVAGAGAAEARPLRRVPVPPKRPPRQKTEMSELQSQISSIVRKPYLCPTPPPPPPPPVRPPSPPSAWYEAGTVQQRRQPPRLQIGRAHV